MSDPPRSRWWALCLCPVLLFGACSPTPDPPGDAPDAASERREVAASGPGRVYERHFVFVAQRTDTALLVPLAFESRTRPGAVARRARGWLVRNGTFDPFLEQSWETPPGRAPWRLLPTPTVRLIVDRDDALDRIVFREEERELELAFGRLMTEWTGPEGNALRIHEGDLLLPAMQERGLVLELGRSRSTEAAPGGDWLVLTSGDSMQLILEEPSAGERRSGTTYRGWSRSALLNATWPQVFVEWAGLRPFERARRDVPIAWSFASSDGRLTGSVEAVGMHLVAGEGSEPLLPVEGYFYLEGSVSLDGREVPVRGILHHLQP